MLKVENLRKQYDTVVAVDGISLEVQRGEVFGLLGPNGAGKTTTIRTVLNIIEPDSGTILFDGKPFVKEMWNSIGYLPEERGLYRKNKIINIILYFSSLKGVPQSTAKQQAAYWLERFGLKNDGHRKLEELSKGNQQKIQIIIALLHQPQLLVLDEPFTGLDPVNQVLLKDILLELRRANVAIIFSTHQMEQVEKLCDHICLINKGKQVLGGALTEVKKRYGSNSIRLEYDGNGDFLKTLPLVRTADIYQNYAELELTDIGKSSEFFADVNSRLQVRKFEIVEPSLNSIFISVVGGPEKLTEAAEKPIPAVLPEKPGISSMAFKDNRVRKKLTSMVLTFAALVLFVFLRKGGTTTGEAAVTGFLLLAWIFSAVQFYRTKRQVEKKLRSGETEERA
jgi:ABC-2 type transport system ATP-binding protein